MADIIQLLPDAIANQIAAGEVVQRPASVVKELLENAVDAGATHIQLIVKDAGKTFLQVIDNGKGMSETDARMSLERHATSKIRKAEDLFSIRTMGFRGEALASIAAVAQLEMKTRLPENELGTLLQVEASEVKRQEPVATEKGTSITVKNLFYNIPARRNFLKSNPVEMNHIVDEFYRVALAYPDIAFTFYNNDQLLFDLPASKLSQRIVNIFGKAYQAQLAACQEETDRMKITGYVGKPEFARKSKSEQFFFVNNRFIRNHYLSHAVKSAFKNLITEDTHPFFVLFIEIDPGHVDINVHPTKTEIKFDDDRSVYAVIFAAVSKALAAHNFLPAIDFQSDVNLIAKMQQADAGQKQQYIAEQFGDTISRNNLRNWEKLFEDPAHLASLKVSRQEEPSVALRFESSINQEEEPVQKEQVLFQLRQQYIVRNVQAGLMIIDQQAAHERVLYELFNKQRGQAAVIQQCLFPQSIQLTVADYQLVDEMKDEIKGLGFDFDFFGKDAIVINGIPGNVKAGKEKELFEGLIEQFKLNQATLNVPKEESLVRALAKRSAIKRGVILSKEEMLALVEQLFACANPNYTPSGKPVFIIFDFDKINSFFQNV
ncbi:MAG TPA: DNA mismatch repair endonuclease MutL [Cyclobacteriaceae bacterium]|nr:DNA mismatch repair endonuclease MutL [Cyclobacteriaceae bacterium]